MSRENPQEQIRQHLRTAYQLSDEKIAKVLPKFLDTLCDHLSAAERALHTNDPDCIRRTGHTLKGALLNLGLADLAELAFALERPQAGDVPGDAGQKTQRLREEIEKIIRAS